MATSAQPLTDPKFYSQIFKHLKIFFHLPYTHFSTSIYHGPKTVLTDEHGNILVLRVIQLISTDFLNLRHHDSSYWLSV